MCFPAIGRSRWALSVCLTASTALAAQLPPRFTLGNFVPDGAWLYVHAVENPEKAWLEQEWAGVFEAFEASGIDKDFMSLISAMISADDNAKVQSTIDKVTGLIHGVRWGDLTKKEFVFSEGVSASNAGWGYAFLFRGAENSGATNFTGLAAILKEVAALKPEAITLREAKVKDIEVWSLTAGEAKGDFSGFVLDLFRKGDIIGLAFDIPFGGASGPSRATFHDITGLINGDSTKKSVVAGARFQEAIALVAPPTDTVVFFDTKMFLGDLGRLFEGIAKKVSQEAAAKKTQAEPGAAPSAEPTTKADEGAMVMGIVGKVIKMADFTDFSITTVETKDRRERTHEVTRLQAGKENSPLASALCIRKPFEKFDQYVPADATGFSLSGFVDLGLIYKLAMDFVGNELPDGKQILEGIQAKMALVGFDPQRDIFDWLSGEMISVTLPPAVVTPMSSTDSVQMIRVKNPELASQKINAFVGFISAQMQQGKGQQVMITPANVKAEGFREITHPMLAMFVRPVFGIRGEWLMIGTSAGAVNKCLETADGKSPSIRENKRFKEEGLLPSGPVLSASFEDTSKRGQEMAAAVGMAGFVGGMAMAGMPEEGEGKKIKQTLQSAMSIIMKLGPVLQKIDFYSSVSATSTYDGKLTIRKESVVTYKPPSAEPERTARSVPAPPAALPPPVPPVPAAPPKR